MQNRDVVGYRKRGVSSPSLSNGSSADRVRREVAAADRRRRAGAASRMLWRDAPLAAALPIAMAAAGRWRGWSPAWPLVLLSIITLALLARRLLAARAHGLPDAVAARIDAAAGLNGELRSASWFSSRDAADPWSEHHLDRAATRLAAERWEQHYPIGPAWRAKAVTAILVAATIGLVLILPPRSRLATAAGGGPQAGVSRVPAAASAEVLLPELQKQLEALLASAEGTTGTPSGTPATVSDLRRLIAALTALRDAGRLQDLARAMAPAAGTPADTAPKALQALAERARKAAEKPGVEPEVRDTLEQVSDQMADAAKAADPAAGQNADASGAAAAKPDPKGASQGAPVDEAAIESVSEVESGGGAGIVMMGSDKDAAGKSAPGLGLGGGSDSRTSAGRMADLEAALRREIIDASADNAGDNVQTETRRKTELGRASVTYAGSSVGAFDRGRAAAPPPVPESRRAAVQTYFIRRQ